jgi:hypothetical protein
MDFPTLTLHRSTPPFQFQVNIFKQALGLPEFAKLLVEGGFTPENIRLIYEPFRIHAIAVCRK